MAEDKLSAIPVVPSRVPRTPTLDALLKPDLFRREPIFTKPLTLPAEEEKVYKLTQEDIDEVMERRGAVVDLHPGMGGVSPASLNARIRSGVKLTSLDYMLTQGCNFKCTWCFAGGGPQQMKAYLPYSKLKSITTDAADLGVSLFILTGGEPLVYKDPALGRQNGAGDHFFKVVEMIRDTYAAKGREAKILTFDDVALITPEIARRFAEFEIGLCTKGDTLIPELQDYKVDQVGAFQEMQRGYRNLLEAGYGSNPKLRLVVNSVLDHTTFDGMVDLHNWVMGNGFDHSIVPIHYCGNAVGEDQEAGIHSPHVFVLYNLLARIDEANFGIKWKPWSAFTYDKTCNRNRSGLHIRANGKDKKAHGDVTACSESPGRGETDRYTFGNIFEDGFSLKELVESERLAEYRREFASGHGTYVCAPARCDLNANDLCMGGCATRSAYSKMDYDTGLIVQNTNPLNYSQHREDPFCPSWTVLALKQGILRQGLLEAIHQRLLDRSQTIDAAKFPFVAPQR